VREEVAALDVWKASNGAAIEGQDVEDDQGGWVSGRESPPFR